MTCFVLQASVSVHGHGSVTTSAFGTVAPGEVLLALVGGVGASAAASTKGVPPSVSLTTTAPSNAVSLAFAVGEDFTSATSHTPVAGQVILDQWLDNGTGDTYWSQYTNTPAVTGTKVTMADTAPTADQANFVAVELIGDAA